MDGDACRQISDFSNPFSNFVLKKAPNDQL